MRPSSHKPTNSWNGCPVLVTGAGGFTGSKLCETLVNAGAHVRAFVRSAKTRCELSSNVELFLGDLTNPKDCSAATAGVDYVFHTAAQFRKVNATLGELRAIHVDATNYLVQAAAEQNVERFVHVSTMGVHGGVDALDSDESERFRPSDDYQTSKLEGEQSALQLGAELDVPVTIIRPCAIYGRGDTRFLKLIRAIAKKRMIMIGDGEIHCHFVHVSDLIQGILLAARTPQAIGEALIIGDAKSLSLNELSEMIAGVTGGNAAWFKVPYSFVYLAAISCESLFRLFNAEPPLHRRRVAFFANSRSFTIVKAKRILHYEPKISLQEGMADMIQWFHEEKLL